jgi:hypothetical protein
MFVEPDGPAEQCEKGITIIQLCLSVSNNSDVNFLRGGESGSYPNSQIPK